MTLQGFLDYFQREHKLKITMLNCGASLLYTFFMPKKTAQERLPMKLADVVETVTKKPIPSHVKAIVLEMCTENEEGEDVEVPYVRMQIRA